MLLVRAKAWVDDSLCVCLTALTPPLLHLMTNQPFCCFIRSLHEEIEDFFQHMSPTVDEHHMRATVFENIKDVIHGLWKEAQVFIFGSFETGLYLPTR